MTWESLARRTGTTSYYVFRGSFASGASVRWGSASVAHASGRIDGRLIEAPSNISIGAPDAIGAAPERVSTGLVLDNTDHAFDAYFIGGSSAATEYSGDSFLNLTGRIYLGLIGDDGTIEEQAVTPTLCVAGSPTSKGGRIILPLASKDEGKVGRVKQLVTVKQIRDTDTTAASGFEAWDLKGRSQTFDAGELGRLLNEITDDDLDTVVPWAFGRPLIPLIYVAPPVGYGARFLAFVSIDEPDISDASKWGYYERDSDNLINGFGRPIILWKANVEVTPDGGGDPFNVWVVGLSHHNEYKFNNLDEGRSERLLLPPSNNPVGLPAGEKATPANVMRWIVRRHSEDGAFALDEDSFARASKAIPIANSVGGMINTDAPLASILSNLCAPGLGLVVDVEDELRCLVNGGFDPTDKDSAATDLPHLTEADVYEGTWEEWLPFAADERGSPVTIVRMEWTEEQRNFWSAQLLRKRAPGVATFERAEPVETTVQGAWFYPPAAYSLMTSIIARRGYPARRVSFVTHPWLAPYVKGSLFRVTHPLGASGSTDGYEYRLMRLEQTELMPGEAACHVVFEDLGPIEALRTGKLDSADNWLAYAPPTGATLTLTGASDVVTSSAAAFTGTLGMTLWTPGAAGKANRMPRKIVEVISSTSARVDETFSFSDVVTISDSTGDLIEQEWLVMRNRATEGWGYRPDYITAANEATAVHSDSEAAFRMLGG